MVQKVATEIFKYASVTFGITGIILVLIIPNAGGDNGALGQNLLKLLFTCVFIILSSFAISIACKYLDSRN